MKLDAADQEESFFQPAKQRVDQSVGFVLTGLCVMLFFAILLMGILKFQSVTTQPNNEPPRSVNQPSLEIGGSATTDQDSSRTNSDTDR